MTSYLVLNLEENLKEKKRKQELEKQEKILWWYKTSQPELGVIQFDMLPSRRKTVNNKTLYSISENSVI